ncbi:MAG: hydantoinase/oxoprolinase family protein [Alphaproteobacteria bacterium]|nr:hydantoinase/oxoprolinase family protein [Alphaproteobacteria bacterium]
MTTRDANADRPVRIAVDIGGTFTDLQIFDGRSGAVSAFKVPTTPADPSDGFMSGITGAAERFGFALDDVALVLHGTTIATNAVLERKLPPAALLTTRGFEDVLEIGRHVRKDIYSLKAEPRPVLVPRRRRFGLAERIRADGSVETQLSGNGVREVIAAMRAGDGTPVEAVAVCLLHAYANPAHERAVRDIILEEWPDLAVSLSSDISPEIREFERSSTTALNALLVPVVARYLDRLSERMQEARFDPHLYLVQSNGGLATPGVAGAQPVRLLLSGPSGGAMAVTQLAAEVEEPNLVGVDMGGTSFDVCVVRDGTSSVVTEGDIDGLPVRLPMMEIRTVGAGGGSIAWIDPGGALHVGPRSAGASPGPVCYGQGGEEPAVTDANVALGRIDPDFFLGGAMRLDGSAAEQAIARRIGTPLGLTMEAAAEGMLSVATANMAAAIKLSLFEKGLDPRDFALASFGGAGGLHAIALAEELSMDRVVFPRDPGTLSAYGILFSDITHDLARSRLVPALPESLPVLRDLLDGLMADGAGLLDRDEIAPEDRDFSVAADMRYRGQAFELLVPWAGAEISSAGLDRLIQDFHDQHLKQFAYNEPGGPVEIVTVRVTAIGRLPKPRLRAFESRGEPAPKAHRRIYLDGGWRETPIYDRDALSMEAPVPGPAIVEEEYTTILVADGWSIAPGKTGDLIARRQSGQHGENAE